MSRSKHTLPHGTLPQPSPSLASSSLVVGCGGVLGRCTETLKGERGRHNLFDNMQHHINILLSLGLCPLVTLCLAHFPFEVVGTTSHTTPSSLMQLHRSRGFISKRLIQNNNYNINNNIDNSISASSTSTSLLPSLQSRISIIRGGAFDDDYSDDEDYDDDFSDSDFDFDDEDGMFDFDMADGDDFGDESTVTAIIEAYHKTPPLTKAYLTASFGAALLGYISNKNDFPSILQLDWKSVMKGQFWRPLTAFLNFGPLGLGYIMTAQFVWTYMSTLERLNHSTPYDFWLMMFFGAGCMVAGYSMMGLSPRFLGHNLSTFLVYVWSRYHEGLEVNMFELFNTRAEMLPWFFLAQVSIYLYI